MLDDLKQSGGIPSCATVLLIDYSFFCRVCSLNCTTALLCCYVVLLVFTQETKIVTLVDQA